jgi:hypothetical protein
MPVNHVIGQTQFDTRHDFLVTGPFVYLVDSRVDPRQEMRHLTAC